MALTEEQIKANANIPTAELKVLRNDLRGNKVPIYQ